MSGISALAALTQAGEQNALAGIGSLASLPDSDTLTLAGHGSADTLAAAQTRAAGVDPSAATSGATPRNGAGNTFAEVLDQVAGNEKSAQDLGAKLLTGELTNVHEFTAAAAQARLSVQTVTAVRNRALDAFAEVMRMQV